MTRTSKTLLALVVLGIAVALAACGDSSNSASGGSSSSKLSLVAYSTPKEAYEEIIPAFAKTPAGAGTSFTQSYAWILH